MVGCIEVEFDLGWPGSRVGEDGERRGAESVVRGGHEAVACKRIEEGDLRPAQAWWRRMQSEAVELERQAACDRDGQQCSKQPTAGLSGIEQ